MSTRERTMAIVLLALLLVGGGGVGGYLFILQPIQQKQTAVANLETEVEKLRGKVTAIRQNAKRLAEARRRSLPADENLARREYTEMMVRLLRQADLHTGISVQPKLTQDSRSVPQLPEKKLTVSTSSTTSTPSPATSRVTNTGHPAYTRIVTTIDFKKADMWQVQDFLTSYYRLNILHQITSLSIKSDSEGGGGAGRPKRSDEDRRDLTVSLTSEAIILDGAEDRGTLLPVSRAFPALLGGAGLLALNQFPEASRSLTPIPFEPVVSTRNRNYSYLAVRDMFHGPLATPTLKIDKIADLVVAPDDTIPPVKVPFTGDLPYVGVITFTATSNSRLIPPGGIRVNQATHTLSLLPEEGEKGEATISIVAKAEGGQEARTKFTVSVKESAAADAKKDDISRAVRLVKVVTTSEGTATALINDNATHTSYEIEASPRRVKVTKWFIIQREKRKRDVEYGTPDELIISDEKFSTNRRLKVVAVAHDSLVLIDLKAPEAKTAEKAPAPKNAKGPVKTPTKEPAGKTKPGGGPADPLAGIAGAAIASATEISHPPQPTLYRWSGGKTLAGLVEIPKDEARQILRHAAESGPVVVRVAAAVAEAPPSGN